MDNHEYLTKEKFDEFTKELADLKGTKRKEVAESLEYAKSLGDLAENAEYHEARDAQATVEDRIAKLEDLLKYATVISNHETNAVNIGSIVTVEKDSSAGSGQAKKITYTIVGTEEADVASGKISIKSPFGQAVLGKKVGEMFSFHSPSGELTYKVTDIK